jgi:hypothetical protein
VSSMPTSFIAKATEVLWVKTKTKRMRMRMKETVKDWIFCVVNIFQWFLVGLESLCYKGGSLVSRRELVDISGETK